MHETLQIFRLASGLARHASARQAIVAANIANADTPGYKARDLAPFAEHLAAADAVVLRRSRPMHRPGPEGDAMPGLAPVIDPEAIPDPNGNSVSLDGEMIRAADIRQQHEMALSVYRSALGILRSAVGRGR